MGGTSTRKTLHTHTRHEARVFVLVRVQFNFALQSVPKACLFAGTFYVKHTMLSLSSDAASSVTTCRKILPDLKRSYTRAVDTHRKGSNPGSRCWTSAFSRPLALINMYSYRRARPSTTDAHRIGKGAKASDGRGVYNANWEATWHSNRS